MLPGRRLRGHFCYSGAAIQDVNSNELCVGVLGMGAIGTIFFTRLGQLATNFDPENKLPRLRVEAFLKRNQWEDWVSKPKVVLSLEGLRKERLEFQVSLDKKVAIVDNAPNVRVCTFEDAAEKRDCNKLDVLLITVKAYDSVRAIQDLRKRHRHWFEQDTLCVLLQNGLGEVPQAKEASFGDRWQFANGVTFVGGRVVQFGRVMTCGTEAGKTYLAPVNVSGVEKEGNGIVDEMLLQRNRDAKIELLARVFLAAGLHCEVLKADEMQAMLWRKLIVNAAINPLASLLDAPNRSVVSSESTCRLVNLVVQEALAVANREKIPLNCSYNELVEDVFEVARNTDANVCSMLADLRRGYRTEIDAITGRIVAGGKRHEVPTPTNELLLLLIKALEEEGTRKICTASMPSEA